jgi:hypothetical protein
MAFCCFTFSPLLGSNVSSYINMVCETLRNTIPKAIVHCQVKEAKRNLLNRFYAHVGSKEVCFTFTNYTILHAIRRHVHVFVVKSQLTA